MATGLRIPVGVDSKGRTATVSGEENNQKIIRVSLTDGDNDNAYMQGLTLDQEGIIFAIQGAASRSAATAGIIRIFNNHEANKRFKLIENSIEWDEQEPRPNSDQEGEVTVRFRYINLESDEPETFQHKFGSGAVK